MLIEKIKSKFTVDVIDYKEDENITFKVPNFLN